MIIAHTGLVSLWACSNGTPADSDDVSRRVEIAVHGRIRTAVMTQPATVNPASAMMVRLTVTTPPGTTPHLPPSMDEWVSGFTIAGSFDRRGVQPNGGNILERYVMMTPEISSEYSISPIPAVCSPDRNGEDSEKIYPTPAVIFATDSGNTQPKHPAPTARIGRIADSGLFKRRPALTIAAVACAILFSAMLLAARTRRNGRANLLSPCDRAINDLASLSKSRMDDRTVFSELSRILRIYAAQFCPGSSEHLTTAEFIRIADDCNAFSACSLDRLKRLLETADIAKYGGNPGERHPASAAIADIRDFIRSDSQDRQAREGEV